MTAPLTRRRAKALIARRLADIGQPADYITAGAADELFARSNDSEAGLLAALAATLFLASTEDASRIDRDHVQQAAPPSELARLATSSAQPPAAALLAGGCVAALVAAICLLLIRKPPEHPVPVPSPANLVQLAPAAAGPALPHAAPAPTSTSQANASQPISAKPISAKPAPPPPPPANANPAPLPTIFVRSPPLPPAAEQKTAATGPAAEQRSPTASPPLPDNPPALVTLVVPAADRLEQTRLLGLAEHLRGAGLHQIRLEEINFGSHLARPIPRNRVFYFFAQDLGLARRVALLLESSEAGDAARNPWAPYLVLPPAGVVPHPPGSIEAYIP